MKNTMIGVVALATVGGVVCARQARADVLASTRGEPLVETEHIVEMEVQDGVATMVVQRTFENRGSGPDQVELEIVLPEGAVATGMRIKGKSEWYDGELMEAEMASVVYESLTGYGPWQMRDPAILFWSDLGTLGLWMFPVSPGTRSTVEYTLTVPVHYRDGKNVVMYPALVDQAELALPEIAVVGPKKAKVWVNGEKVAAGKRVSVGIRVTGDDGDGFYGVPLECEMDEWDEEWAGESAYCPEEGMAQVQVQSGPIDTVDVRYGAFSLAGEGWLVRLEIDAAKVLRPAPVKASVVFVVDGSITFGQEGVAAAVQLARAYAAQLPDARFEIVIFRHRASRVLGDLVDAEKLDEAVRDLDASVLAVGNGSHLDEGLRLASSILAARKGPRRIVAITDSVMRSSYSNATSLQVLETASKGLVVHVVDLAPGAKGDEAALERDDGHELAPAALGHGGIAVRITDGCRKADYVQAARELVRPVRIDGFSVTGIEDETDMPWVLPEGKELRAMFIGAQQPTFVRIEGRIWAEHFSRIVAVDQDYSYDVLPAMLFSSEIFWMVDEKAQMSAAAAAGAVSPLTSYLCVEPGVRPSVQGLDHGSGGGGLGLGGLGMMGMGAGGGGYSSVLVPEPDYASILGEQAREAAAHCFTGAAPDDDADAWIETTWHEIVDVKAYADPPGIAECIETAIWGVDLDPVFDGKPRFQFHSSVSPLPPPG